jgi:hypothetical protein
MLLERTSKSFWFGPFCYDSFVGICEKLTFFVFYWEKYKHKQDSCTASPTWSNFYSYNAGLCFYPVSMVKIQSKFACTTEVCKKSASFSTKNYAMF